MARDGRQNRPAREQALIVAASRLFASQGFESTTTREIAAEAGCAEGLIHRYFGGKYGLLLAIINARTSQEFLDLDQKLPLADTLEEDLVQMVEFDVDRMWNDRDFLRVIIPSAFFDVHLAKLLASVPSRRTAAIRERLKKFSAGRSMHAAELDTVAVFVSIIGFMFGFMRPVSLGHELQYSKDIARNLARIFAAGLNDSMRPADTSRDGLSAATLPPTLFS